MVSLDDFPEHRLEALLWKYALELDYDGVEDLVVTSVGQPCFGLQRDDWNDLRAMVAVLGDDGRYHLRHGQHMLCSELRGDRAIHAQGCYWWTDRAHTLYRTIAPAAHPDRDSGEHTRQVEWTVRLSSTVLKPESAPDEMRCPVNRGPWPSFHNPATKLGQIRIQLTTELGRHCNASKHGPAFAVDHDHVTGLVGGMLCRTCNSHVDRCPHLSGCHFAATSTIHQLPG